MIIFNDLFPSSFPFPTFRHPDESRDPDCPHVKLLNVWIPAFAGMTVFKSGLKYKYQRKVT